MLCAQLQICCEFTITPHDTETLHFAPQVQLEVKIDQALLSCNTAQTSTYHLKGRGKALLHVHDFIGSAL